MGGAPGAQPKELLAAIWGVPDPGGCGGQEKGAGWTAGSCSAGEDAGSSAVSVGSSCEGMPKNARGVFAGGTGAPAGFVNGLTPSNSEEERGVVPKMEGAG